MSHIRSTDVAHDPQTQSQHTYDAKRERDLQELGWRVIRFTGSEIHNDVNGCVE